MTKKEATKWLGPSLAESKKAFVHAFGSELELLMEINQWLSGEREVEIKGLAESESSFPF
jgi:hypothetical protein